jgi:hypothetical protein
MAHGIERNLHGRISGALNNFCKGKSAGHLRGKYEARNPNHGNRAEERTCFGLQISSDEKPPWRSLESLDRQNLTAFVIAAGRAGAMRRNRAAALAALAELGSVKTVGGFARAQPHFGHLSFWNTHGS